jgi:hypothetical protein
MIISFSYFHHCVSVLLYGLLIKTMSSMRLQLVTDVGLVLLLASATSARVHLGGDGVGDVRELLLLLLEVLGGGLGAALLEPVDGLLDGLKKL